MTALTSGERLLNRREAATWRALGWLFEEGVEEYGICRTLFTVRDEPLRRCMTTRLHAWFGPEEAPEQQLAWWPFNKAHHTPAERRDGLHNRALACGFLAALCDAGDPLTPTE
jgi:hypothetical protein